MSLAFFCIKTVYQYEDKVAFHGGMHKFMFQENFWFSVK